MKRVFQLGACAIAVFALAATTGCSNDPDPAPGVTVAPALKGDGVTAANFACVGLGNPYTGGATIAHGVFVGRQPISGSPPGEPDVTVSRIDAADGTTVIGSPSAATIADGTATMDLEDNAVVALKLDAAASDIVPTYYYNYINEVETPPDTVSLLVIPAGIRDAFIGLYGVNPSEFAGQGLGAGAVVDCDGDDVMNAVIELSQATLVGYFGGGSPDKNAIATDDDGQFVVAGIPVTSAPITITAKVYTGTEAEGTADTVVAEGHAQFYADSVTITVVAPKPD